MIARFWMIACLLVAVQVAQGQSSPPYRNASLPIHDRVQDLLRRMTPEEKFWQLFMIPGDLGTDSTKYQHGIFGFQVNTVQQQQGAAAQMLTYSAAQTAQQTRQKINSVQRYFVEQTRLGIPIIAFDESLHGLVRSEATAFPQSIALAATWDTALMRRVAAAIANETKSRGIRQVLSPVLNLATDPRWGRTEETYGEDPIDNWEKQSYHTRLAPVYFEKGKAYAIRIEYREPAGNAWFRLIWTVGIKDDAEERIRAAVAAVQQSDVAIIVAGIEEGEFRDRASLALPGKQEELIRAIAATGKPVVVLLVGGSAITMDNWVSKASAVAMIWYPGEAGGVAVADMLWGDVNPSGKLPISFPLSEAQLPWVYYHKPTGRGDDYNNLTGMPLFPFGYGLSYTQFTYSDLHLSSSRIRTTDSLQVILTVSNSGTVAGEEVVQLYLHDELASVARPLKELKAFQRVLLKAGESKTVAFTITPEMLTMWDANMKQVIEPGAFRLMIGSSSIDIRLREIFYVE